MKRRRGNEEDAESNSRLFLSFGCNCALKDINVANTLGGCEWQVMLQLWLSCHLINGNLAPDYPE